MHGDDDIQRDQWTGLVAGHRSDVADVSLVLIAQYGCQWTTGVFSGVGDDGNTYYIKPVENGRAPVVPVTEHIIARVGSALGAPVCPSLRMAVSEDFDGEYFTDQDVLRPGLAHASLEIVAVEESREMRFARRDDNVRRHMWIRIMWDLCFGSDPQWLVCGAEDRAYYSCDHEQFLPPAGTERWDEDSLITSLHEPHRLEGDFTLESIVLFPEVLESLRRLDRTTLTGIMRGVPKSWPVSDRHLETAGHFLETRARRIEFEIQERLRGL